MKPKSTLRALLLGSSLFAAPITYAATITWDGDTSANWSDAGNWDTAPVDGDALVFSGTANQTNANDDFLTSIGLLTLNGANWNINLGTLTLNSGITASGTSALTGALTLGAAQTWQNSTGLLTISGTVANGGNLLALGGAGNTTIASNISGTGGLTKSGTGTLTLSGGNTYNGTTTLGGGTLALGNHYSTSALAISADSAITVARGYTSTWAGSLTGSSDLTLAGGAGATSGTLSLVGNGGNTFNGDITVGVGAGTLRIAGTLFATGTAQQGFSLNSMTASNTITVNRGGTFNIDDNATGSSAGYLENRFGSAGDRPAVSLNGGTFNLNGFNAAGTNTQTLGALTLASGPSTINVTRNNASNTTSLVFSSLTPTLGATVNFTGTSLGTAASNVSQILFTSSPSLVGGIIGGHARAGNEWATYGANGVTALTTYGTVIQDAASTDNIKVTGAQTITGSNTINSLNWNFNGNLDLGANGLTLVSGGFIKQNNHGNQVIGTTGFVTAGAGDGVATALTVYQNANQTLTWAALVKDNTAESGNAVAFVKDGSGPGTVSFTQAGDNNYSGGTFVNTGTLQTGTTDARRYLGTGAVRVDNAQLTLGHRGATSFSTANQAAYTALNGGQISIANQAYTTASDTFNIGAGSILAGSATTTSGNGLNSLTRVASLTGISAGQVVLAPGSIVAFGGTLTTGLGTGVLTLAGGAGTNADLYFGLGANAVANSTITVGAGTPWLGISTDRTTRNFASGTITANSDFNLQGLGVPVVNPVVLNMGSGGAMAVDTPNGDVNANILGAVTWTNSSVALGSANNNLTFQVNPGATFTLASANALGASAGSTVGVVVQSGGTLGIGNSGAINAATTIQTGGIFNANQATGITGTGSLNFERGSIINVTGVTGFSGSQASAITTTVAAGTIVRLNVANFGALGGATLDSFLGSKSPIYQISGGNRSAAVPISADTTILTLNKDAYGVGGMLIDDGGSRNFALPVNGGVITVGANGGVIAATTGANLQVQYPIILNGNLTIGTTESIEGFQRLGVVQLTGSATITLGASVSVANITPSTFNCQAAVVGGVNILTLGGTGDGLNSLTGGLSFSGAGGLIIDKSGTLGTTISGGTITLGGTGGITINSGASAVGLGANTVSANQSWTNNSATTFTVSGATAAAGNILTLSGNGDGLTTLSGLSFSDAGGLVISKSGALGATIGGTINLGGTGGITINSGASAVSLGANTVSANQSWTNNSGNTFTVSGAITAGSSILGIGGSGDTTFSSTISGDNASAIDKNGNGVLTLIGNSTTYTGIITLNSGTLKVAGGNNTSNLGTGVATLALNGGILDLATTNNSGINYGRNTTVSGNSTILSNRAASNAGFTYTLGTLGIGSNTLTAEAGGNATGSTAGLTFGTTTLSGNTVFNVGFGSGSATGMILTLGALSDDGSGRTITKQGAGRLTWGAITLSGAHEWINNGAGTFTAGAVTGGANTLTLSGTGDGLTNLSGGLSFSGAGGLIIGKSGTLGTTISGGTITLGGTGGIVINSGASAVILGANTVSANQSWTNNSGSTFTVSGAVTGGASILTLDGTGDGLTTLTGGLSFSDAGGLIIGKSGTLGTTISGGTINLAGTGGITINSGTSLFTLGAATIGAAQTWTNSSSTAMSASGALALTNKLTLAGGDFIFSGTNTGSGGIDLTGGNLIATVAAGFGPNTNTLFFKGGNLELRQVAGATAGTTYNGLLNAVTNGGTITINRTDNGGTATTHTAGTLAIGAGNTLSVVAGSNIDTGVNYGLTLGNTTVSGNALFNVANNGLGLGTMTLGALTQSGGPWSVTKLGAGILTLSGANAVSGGLIIEAGTVKLGNTTAAGSGLVTLGVAGDATFGTLDLNGASRTINSLATAGTAANQIITSTVTGGVLNYTGATTSTFGGLITGSTNSFTSLTLNNASANLTLSGANTYAGATTLTNGTLKLANQLAVQNSTVTMAGGASGALVFDESVVGNAFTLGGLAASAAGAGYDIALQNNAGSPAAIALTVGGNDASTTYAGVLSGSGSLIKTGSGTLTLSNASNSYSGGTTINGGRLSITADAHLGNSSGTITFGGGELYITNDFSSARSVILNPAAGNRVLLQGNGDWINSGNFTGDGGITFRGNPNGGVSATLTSTSNDFKGALGIESSSGGVIVVKLRSLADSLSANGNIVFGALAATQNQTFEWDSAASGGLILDNRRIEFAGDGDAIARILNSNTTNAITINTDLAVIGTGTKTLTLEAVAGTTNFFGAIDDGLGTVALTKAGAGTWVLSKDNGYTGATLISAGSLQLGNGGTTGSLTGTSSITNSANLTINRSNAFTQATDFNGQIITGTGSFTQAGAGTTTLSLANTYSGSSTVAGGTLNLSNQLAVQNSTLTMNGGSLVFDQSVVGNAFTFGGLAASASGTGYDIALQNNAISPASIALTVGGNNANTTYAGVLSGGGSLTKTGSGTLTLSNTSNSYSGGTILNAGQLSITSDANLGASTGDITFTGDSTLNINATGFVMNADRSITINDGVTATFASNNDGKRFAGSLEGSGTLFVNHTTSFIFDNASSFTGSFRVNTANNSAYGLDMYTLRDEAGDGTISLENGSFRWFGSGGTKTFDDRQFFLGSSSGGSIFNRSTDNSALVITQNLGQSGTGTRTLTLGGNASAAGTFAGNIGDNGDDAVSVTKTEVNTWNLSGTANSFTGAITLNSTTTSAGTLSYASAAGTNSITFNQTSGSATLAYTGATPLTMSGLISATALTSGTIRLDASGTNPNAAINYSNASSLTSVVTGNNIRKLVLSGSNTGANTFNGAFTDNVGTSAATLTKEGEGRWVLTGNNAYTGATTINGGVLEAMDGTGLPTASLLQLRGGVFQSSGTFTRNVGTSAGNVDWSTSSGGFAAHGGDLILNLNGGTGSLTWNDSSMVTTGQTLIFGSTSADSLVDWQNGLKLAVTGNNDLNRTISVIDNPDSTTDRARISGNITSDSTNNGIIKAGDGVLELTGTNSYNGVTAINGGTLVVGVGGVGSITSNVTVNDGGTLGGTGIITGDLVVNSGGTHAVGSSPGLQTINGQTTYNAGSIFEWDLAGNVSGTSLTQTWDHDNNIGTAEITARGSAYDAVNINGGLTINADAIFKVIMNAGVDFNNVFWTANQTWSNIFNQTGTLTSGWSDLAVSVYNTSNVLQDVSSYGSFTMTGATLSWQAVPEPTTALAGLLLAAGLLRRRR
jgi:autotransporter-associated beta strand protein